MTTEDKSFRATGGDSAFGFSTTLGANLAVGAFVRGNGSGVVGVTPVNFEPFAPGVSISTFGVFGCAGGNGPGHPHYADNAGVRGTSPSVTGVAGTSFNRPGVYGQLGDFPTLPVDLKTGVLGASATDGSGVVGISTDNQGVVGTSNKSTGVFGRSDHEYGVQGISGAAGPALRPTPHGPVAPPPRNAGVLGTSQDAIGTAGTSFTQEGVLGLSRDAAGVSGTSQTAPGVIGGSGLVGVFGVSGAFVGAAGWSLDHHGAGVLAISGDPGPSFPGVPDDRILPAGVTATSHANPGVIATSSVESGVVGFSETRFGVWAISRSDHGVFGVTLNPAAYAGAFAGNGYFRDNLIVEGRIFAGVKDAIVPFPDGSKRVLHCMESPEHWFEDFGSAKLTRGRAVVKLDADFAKVIKLGDYSVFLTPEGDCQGLYVGSKRGASFEVRELRGGTSSITFSYRIVGKRKDIKDHKRFAKIEVLVPTPPAEARAMRGRKAAQAPSSIPAQLAKLEKHAREQLRTTVTLGRAKHPRLRSRGRR